MEAPELSQMYFRASARIHDLATELYEELHTPSGLPIEEADQVAVVTNKYSRWMRSELDFVRSANQEYNEEK